MEGLSRDNENIQPPVILSPPPVPERHPTFENMWARSPYHSAANSPRTTPRASPMPSPRNSPFPSPHGSPIRKRKSHSPPDIPKPYSGNSSILQKNNVNVCESQIVEPTNVIKLNEMQAQPVRDLHSPPIPALPERHPNNTKNVGPLQPFKRSPKPNRKDLSTNSLKVRKSTRNLDPAETVETVRRISRSDERLDKCMDCDDLEDVGIFKRSNSVLHQKQEKVKLYEPIFSAESYLFPKKKQDSPSDSGEIGYFPTFDHPPRRVTSLRAADRNRPVPLPPSVIPAEETGEMSMQRPMSLQFEPVHFTATGQHDQTPVLPPKKSKVLLRRSASAETSSQSNDSTEQTNDVDSTLNSTRFKSLPLQSESDESPVEKESPFDDEFNADMAFQFGNVSSHDGSTNSQDGLPSEVYYPWPKELGGLSEVLPDNKDFYDDDEIAMNNYDAPVPVVRSPTDTLSSPIEYHENQATNFAVCEDDSMAGDSEVFEAAASDPFSDPFFNNLSEDTVCPPPVPPHARNMASNGVHRRSSSPDTSLETDTDSRLESTIDRNTGEVIVAGPGRFFDQRQTRQENKPMQFYDQDFEILMAQGYSREDIKKALMVANNNFAIARNILKEFTPLSK